MRVLVIEDDPGDLKLVRVVLEGSRTRAVPVVALTAFVDCFLQEGLVKAGGKAVIAKPLDQRMLSHEIAQVAEEKGL